MPWTNPRAASTAMRRIPLFPADIDQQVGMTPSGRRPTSAWVAQAAFDAEYLQWRGLQQSSRPDPGQAPASSESCLRDCLSCAQALQGLACREGVAVLLAADPRSSA